MKSNPRSDKPVKTNQRALYSFPPNKTLRQTLCDSMNGLQIAFRKIGVENQIDDYINFNNDSVGVPFDNLRMTEREIKKPPRNSERFLRFDNF